MVAGNHFEALSAALNLSSAVATALSVQYDGIDVGYNLGYPGFTRSAAQAWPSFSDSAFIVDGVFGVLFTVELVLKCAVYRQRIVSSAWSWLDIVAVLGWWFEKALEVQSVMNPMTMRLMRLAKLARIARKLKSLKVLDSLQVLVGSIVASLSVLGWSVTLLAICHLIVALLLHSSLYNFMVDETKSREKRELVYMYFGTFTRSMLSMFELTLGNWITITRLLTEHVSEWWAIPMLIYKMFMGFAVVKVITGVFLHETFKVAATDDELMVVQKTRATAKYQKQMKSLFTKADVDSNGNLSRDELAQVLGDTGAKTLLAAMDLEVNDTNVLFEFIKSQHSELISIQEFIDGVQRLKGTARSIDVVALMRKTLNLELLMQEMRERLANLKTDNYKVTSPLKFLA